MQASASSLLWRITGVFSFAAFILFTLGFFTALDPQTLAPAKPPAPVTDHTSPTKKSPIQQDGTLTIVALGDSLTRGAGDANGLGYIGLVRESLEKNSEQKVTLTNLAINGSQSYELLQQLDQTQVKTLISEADLVLFTIGGNDLFKQSGDIADLDKKKLTNAANTLASNFELIIKKARAINNNNMIIYTSLYNPFGDTEAAGDTTPPVLAWNTKASEIASRYRGVVVVPTYDLFLQKEKAYLYTDHFHPNSAGYRRIAQRILQAIQ